MCRIFKDIKDWDAVPILNILENPAHPNSNYMCVGQVLQTGITGTFFKM